MLPLAVNEVTQVGLEAVAAAFAYGASALRFLLRARPRHDVTGDGTCAYAGSGFEVHTEELKSPASWTGSMREMIEEKQAERVDRIGDEAVVFVDSNRDYAIASRKGKRIVTVTMYKDQSTLVDAKPVLVELLTRAMSKVH